MPKWEKNYLKCENEGIFGVFNRQNPKKIIVMKMARFYLCLVLIESQKYECILKFIHFCISGYSQIWLTLFMDGWMDGWSPFRLHGRKIDEQNRRSILNLL